jgi:hypothetical protein
MEKLQGKARKATRGADLCSMRTVEDKMSEALPWRQSNIVCMLKTIVKLVLGKIWDAVRSWNTVGGFELSVEVII